MPPCLRGSGELFPRDIVGASRTVEADEAVDVEVEVDVDVEVEARPPGATSVAAARWATISSSTRSS